MRTLIKLFLLAVLALAVLAAWQVYVPVAPAGQQFVMLRPGYSTRHIASELKKNGIIHSELAFLLWHATHPKPKLKAGEYLFEHEATLPQVYGRIARGDIYFHVVTIPEGYTMFDIAKAMEEAGLCPATDFLHIAQTQTDLISDIAPNAKSLEGYLFPNTYQFTRTQSLEEMTSAMVRQFRQVAHDVGLIPAETGIDVEKSSPWRRSWRRKPPLLRSGRAWPASTTTVWRKKWRSMPTRALSMRNNCWARTPEACITPIWR